MDLSTWTAKEDSPLIRCFRRGFSSDEEDLIIRLYCLLGNRWSLIAGRVPGRTDKQIEKYWHSTLSRKFAMKRLIRPRTHRLLSLHMKRFRHNEKEQHSAFMAPKFNQEQNLLLGSVDNAVPSSEGNTINAETKVPHSVPQADPCQKMVGLKPSMEEISTVDTTSITKDLGLRFHTMQMQCKIEDSCSGTWGRY